MPIIRNYTTEWIPISAEDLNEDYGPITKLAKRADAYCDWTAAVLRLADETLLQLAGKFVVIVVNLEYSDQQILAECNEVRTIEENHLYQLIDPAPKMQKLRCSLPIHKIFNCIL